MKKRVRLLAVSLVVFGVLAPGWASSGPSSRLVNLSSRAAVGTGADVLIAGFAVSGTSAKDVLVRAVGPSLTAAGVAGALAEVRLQVFDAQGRLLASNEQWKAELKGAFAMLGAAPLAEGSRDAALRLTLAPGTYSAQVAGLKSARGVALVEVYEVDGGSRLLNLSTRARVESGDGILISGLVVTGNRPRRLLLRAGGPALAGYGVGGTLADPSLAVLNAQGVTVAANDNWSADGAAAAELTAVGAAAGAFPFAAGSKDAALLAPLAPGLYSVQVRGAGAAAGVALLEAYDVTVDETASNPTGGSNVYATSALSWEAPALDARLGPTFAQLHPGATDDRPTLYQRPSKDPGKGYFTRIKPYELGEPGPDTDYWSDSGQVAYLPDDPANDPGLDRIQTYAYYNRVFAISPRLDWASGKPHGDPQTRESSYATLNGAPPQQPIALVRNQAMEQNEAIVIYRDGLFAVAGTQTSRAGGERPYPGFKFPANKVPRAVAVTTSNEFALVAVWDTDRRVGQLAVVALEGRYLAFHTWPYMAMPNQGSFSAFKLLGYVDLPMGMPSAVAAASNGLWNGPSSTGGKVLSQINLADDAMRQLVYGGAWQAVVAKGGYAIVASTEENQVAIVDLTPLFAYVRESYLGSAENFAATLAARGPAPEQFPQSFALRPEIAPKVIWQGTVDQPTAVLAGQSLDRWSKDRFKAYVAARDGTVHILDTSPLMARNAWEITGTLQKIGTVKVGRNPVSLVFARYGANDLPLLPDDSTGVRRRADGLNNLFYVACRGDREVDAVVTWHGEGAVYQRVKDVRMGDPVAVSVARRGNILTVADFAGRKLLSFRMGPINDLRNEKVYGCGADGADPYEFAGELPLAGRPFLVNSTNVN